MEKNSFIFFVLAAIAFSTYITAQDLNLGFCVEKQGVDYLNVDSFLNVWYVYARSAHFIEDIGSCTALIFHRPVKGVWPVSRLMVTNIFGYQTNMTLHMKIEGAGKGESDEGYKITFVDVVYDKYAVIYGCRQFSLLPKQEIIWILTRSRDPSSDTIVAAYNAINKFGLSSDGIKPINQTGCPNIKDFK